MRAGDQAWHAEKSSIETGQDSEPPAGKVGKAGSEKQGCRAMVSRKTLEESSLIDIQVISSERRTLSSTTRVGLSVEC